MKERTVSRKWHGDAEGDEREDGGKKCDNAIYYTTTPILTPTTTTSTATYIRSHRSVRVLVSSKRN